MAGNKLKLVIIGDGETAELAYDYFTGDSAFDVVGFSAERAFKKNDTLLGLPVVAFEEMQRFFDPHSHTAFVAVSYTQLNRLRQRLFKEAKAKGYTLCTYISPKAFIARNVQVGENCFILENVTIQRGATIGDNVTIWSGTAIGHRSVVGNGCFLASHTAVSGFCSIGENCFLGVNCCTVGNVKIAADCVVGAGAVVVKDAAESGVYVGNPAKNLPNKSTTVFVTGEETI
jgi:sugar O-acyltransferase (sialic acid O-acetyltransferase NeuD family)